MHPKQKKQAIFRFYEELNDFLPPTQCKQDICYTFTGSPSVKDAVEAIGVPHTEIDLILVNQNSVEFTYQLQPSDRVAVYPVFESLDISPVTHLRPKPLRINRFILDVQLGKLAKALRMLGFDALYSNDYQDSELIRIALVEHRIILTRDRGILKYKAITHGYWVRRTTSDMQLAEVIKRFDLKNQIHPFTRCLLCNGILEPVEKAKIIHRLPKKTSQYFDTFYHCPQCDKLYWPGSHYQRMQDKIKSILNSEQRTD
jgi:uncharacterized protein with PIN domain